MRRAPRFGRSRPGPKSDERNEALNHHRFLSRRTRVRASFVVTGSSVAAVIPQPPSSGLRECDGPFGSDRLSLQIATKARAPADRRRLQCAHYDPPVFPDGSGLIIAETTFNSSQRRLKLTLRTAARFANDCRPSATSIGRPIGDPKPLRPPPPSTAPARSFQLRAALCIPINVTALIRERLKLIPKN